MSHGYTQTDKIGPYRLEERLGAGGMGEVYRAYDERLDRQVALKHILPEAARSTHARARFIREARSVAQLNHPSIVQIHDLLETDDGDWLVMELVEGEPLYRLLPLDLDRALRLARQIAEGLSAAHARGIIHRDLKVENVIVTADGAAKILDFGLAKPVLAAERDPAISDDGQVVGTPRAMSPEQAQGRAVDLRSDLFSFGVLLYEMTTGASPFAGPGPAQILRRICTARQTPACELAPQISRELSDLIDHLLEKDPAHRPRTSSEVASVLRNVTRAEETSSLIEPSTLLALELPTLDAGQPDRRRPGAGRGPVQLRVWPQPKLPDRPYPLLLPYGHPQLLAGRERELAQVRQLLGLPIAILGLYAPSGAGKSSLLWGGLTATLRAEGKPVAFDRHPHEPGLAGRLIADLLDLGADREPLPEDPPDAFVNQMLEVRTLAGCDPILVLDQFEDLLRPDQSRARARVGTLLAASVARQPGLEAPPCRWLVAYRQEFHGAVLGWLGDVLSEAREEGFAAAGRLPADLSAPDRFHGLPLLPLGHPPPGTDARREAAEAFSRAITTPLELALPDGTPCYPWRFADGAVERLAQAFAAARLARPEAPLTPELQVVLAHLMEAAADPGDGTAVIEVPEDPGRLIAEALEAHLKRALDVALPTERGDSRQARARALLVLRELAEEQSRHGDGLPAATLDRALGGHGTEILESLSSPRTRLLVTRQHADGWRYALAHDNLAEAIVRTVDQEARQRELAVDAELVALRRFVALKSALYRSGEEQATRLPRRHHRRLEAHAEALLWGEDRRQWWQACRERRRIDVRRRAVRTITAAVALCLVIVAAWILADLRQRRQALLEQIVSGEPEAALAAFVRLDSDGRADLGSLLARRDAPPDVLARGLGGVPPERRSDAVLRLLEVAWPIFEASPEDPALLAPALWALDAFPGRAPRRADEATAWRERLLRPLRQRRPPPPMPDPQDRSWVTVPAGTFQMGTGAGEGSDGEEYAAERPRHPVAVSAFRIMAREVTRGEYRRLVPGHEAPAEGEPAPAAGELPAARVTWYEAYTYAAWLGGRLPTEAEWEYAARAGCLHEYCTSSGDAATLDQVGWYRGNSSDPETLQAMPHPVARREPNPWGLYDMYGNVWEWVGDWFAPYSPDARQDPIGPTGGAERCARGGGYWSPAGSTRAAYRLSLQPEVAIEVVGFRVVLPARQ